MRNVIVKTIANIIAENNKNNDHSAKLSSMTKLVKQMFEAEVVTVGRETFTDYGNGDYSKSRGHATYDLDDNDKLEKFIAKIIKRKVWYEDTYTNEFGSGFCWADPKDNNTTRYIVW